jgi:hypothetical protein
MKQTTAVLAKDKQFIGILANCELRSVPLWWQHPTDGAGEPIPLERREFAYTEAEIAELVAEGRTRAEIDAWFMPAFSDVPPHELGVAVYETTTEGTPITPIFPATRAGLFQLLQYCAANCATFADFEASIDAWARLLGLEHVLANRPAS